MDDVYQEEYVIKRDGSKAPVRYDSITDRNQLLTSSLYGGHELSHVATRLPGITREVMNLFVNGMSTSDLDILTASVCAGRSTHHRDYPDLAARIIISDLHKKTQALTRNINSFDADLASSSDGSHTPSPPSTPSDKLSIAHVAYLLKTHGKQLDDEMYHIMIRGAKQIDQRLDYRRDYSFDLFGINTMMNLYLLKVDIDGVKHIVERPQHAYMRVALAHSCSELDEDGNRIGHLVDDDTFNQRLESAFEEYEYLSTKKLSMATPVMCRAGCKVQQLASCFLSKPDDDMWTLAMTMTYGCMMSKDGGGIGLDVTPMRCEGAYVNSSGFQSDGIVPYLRFAESMKRFVRQGPRKGACAVYCSMWHADIESFLVAPREKNVDEKRNAPDLMYGLWVSDIFMKVLFAELAAAMGTDQGEQWASNAEKVLDTDQPGDWYLMCPRDCPELNIKFGDDFEAAYRQYATEGNYKRKVKASHLMREAFKTTSQKGNPYVLFGDNINNTSNMAHIRKITMSNLCSEVTIPAYYNEHELDQTEIGVCVLAAVALGSFVIPDARAPAGVRIDWQGIYDTARIAIRNLDRSIDINRYPVEPCRRSTLRHRPIGLGLMGLADVFASFKYEFGSDEAKALDQALAAVIYYAAKTESSELGKKLGNFETFEGSWSQRGYLQPDLWVERGHLSPDWETAVADTTDGFITPGMWTILRESCKKHLRNAYVNCFMPTATSANVVGQSSCFEPIHYVMYTRRTLAGEYVIFNKHFLNEVDELGLWSDSMRRSIIAGNGSIQHLTQLPEDVRRRYRTVRELDQCVLTEHAAMRNAFCEQSQSLNYYWHDPKFEDYLSVLCLGWKKGLTTGSYYQYSQAGEGSQQSSVVSVKGKNKVKNDEVKSKKKTGFICTDEVCTACAL